MAYSFANPLTRPDLAEELAKNIECSIRQCEKMLEECELWKLAWILRSNGGADENQDWQMSYNDCLIKADKFEKQVWVAIKKRNWVLTEPFRKKFREVADEAMECMEVGVSKGFMPEEEYVKSANTFKDTILEMEKVTATIKMFFQVEPIDPAKLGLWWGQGVLSRGVFGQIGMVRR